MKDSGYFQGLVVGGRFWMIYYVFLNRRKELAKDVQKHDFTKDDKVCCSFASYLIASGGLIGNALINDETYNLGMYDYLTTHTIISDQATHDINIFCNFSSDDNPIQCRTTTDEAVAYAEVYTGGITFAKVREAGHEVPSYQPGRALSLIMHFLKDTPLPTTKTQP
ncbi:unnamed protein product [Lupinus luteus]|uniref:Uncharacterized protein n=1 Tax=Lupinus luteus TaxID=3873 RepID=A0AAV1WAZ5_LUPLU